MISRRNILKNSSSSFYSNSEFEPRTNSKKHMPNALIDEDEDVWYDQKSLFKDHVREIVNKFDQLDDEIWGKIICMERNHRVAKAYARFPVICVNDGNIGFDGDTIGLCGFDNPYSDSVIVSIKKNAIGNGVAIGMDPTGSIKVELFERTNVYVKGWHRNVFDERSSSIPDDIVVRRGKLSYKKVNVVFDMKLFLSNMREEMKQRCSDSKEKLENQCITIVSFGKSTTTEILDTPVWIMVINMIALQMVQENFQEISKSNSLASDSVKSDSDCYNYVMTESTPNSSVCKFERILPIRSMHNLNERSQTLKKPSNGNCGVINTRRAATIKRSAKGSSSFCSPNSHLVMTPFSSSTLLPQVNAKNQRNRISNFQHFRLSNLNIHNPGHESGTLLPDTRQKGKSTSNLWDRNNYIQHSPTIDRNNTSKNKKRGHHSFHQLPSCSPHTPKHRHSPPPDYVDSAIDVTSTEIEEEDDVKEMEIAEDNTEEGDKYDGYKSAISEIEESNPIKAPSGFLNSVLRHLPLSTKTLGRTKRNFKSGSYPPSSSQDESDGYTHIYSSIGDSKESSKSSSSGKLMRTTTIPRSLRFWKKSF